METLSLSDTSHSKPQKKRIVSALWKWQLDIQEESHGLRFPVHGELHWRIEQESTGIG